MKQIPYSHQCIEEDDIRAVIKVLHSSWITQGPNINEFEAALCKYTGAKYAVVVSSGTAALHIACLAAGLKPHDEVITSPVTFAASANCVLYCNAKPVFADIQPDTINIDPQEIQKKLTKKTKALIPVHFAGHPCDMHALHQIAKSNNLIIIEDAAHALGAEYKSSKIGSCSYSDMAIFSFHPVKSIATGEGGAVMTNNKKLYDLLVKFRSHGITKQNFMYGCKGSWYYEMQELGFNYRITDIQAALGKSQMRKLERFISGRRKIAAVYDKAFKGHACFDVPVEKKGIKSAYHIYPIQLKGTCIGKRKEIFDRLRNRGLGVQVHYMPVYLHPYYRNNLEFTSGLCPAAEFYYSRAISLPLYPSLTSTQVHAVVRVVKEVFTNA